MGKPLFDGAVAWAALLALAPLMLAIALLIKLTSRGPVFYRQIRVGANKHPFILYKFRSMHVDAERHGPQWARRDDPRATAIGRVLRRTHLDELPQLINVLKGEMSLVGPRPERPVFVVKLGSEIENYPLRLSVKPGITGLAQVKHHADRTLDDVRIKLGYDLHYVRSCGFWMDLRIIAATASMMLTGPARNQTNSPAPLQSQTV